MTEKMETESKVVKAPRGTGLNCKGWVQEAAFRMIQNNLDPDVAEKPEELIVYGGTGKAARNWESFHRILEALKQLENDETLLVQSGKPVGIIRTSSQAPRVFIVNSMIVPHWATWENFREYERMGLTMFGQMTAGSWIYIGSQGIIQGTYETFAEIARRHFGDTLKGRWVLTAGMGGMGGAQPLAVTFNGASVIVVEVDESRIKRRVDIGFCDRMTDSLDETLKIVLGARDRGEAASVGLLGNAADVYPEILKRGLIPDIVTDQTSAHDELNGYVPAGIPYQEALRLRKDDPKLYVEMSYSSMVEHCRAMVDFQKRGTIVFDYGNNIRAQAKKGGLEEAFEFPGFVKEYIRPQFCEGRGPFRWVALSGKPADIQVSDEAILRTFPENRSLERWIRMASKRIPFQGLPARICWLGYGERARFGKVINDLVKAGELKAPIVIGRDHLDSGSVASPNRETEGMKDGSDAIADWPILNALLNAVSGASWVAVHHGGGVGIGFSIHAGMVVVADGTEEQERKIVSVLNSDPWTGIMRHVDAGYEEAMRIAEKHDLKVGDRLLS